MAAVATLFAACSNDDMPTPVVDAMTDKPVTVNADVAELLTRAGMTSDDLATLGITITNAASPLYTYHNVKFVKDGSATGFTPAEGEVTPLWQNATQEVSVSAWSPYVDVDVTNGYAFNVQADQTTVGATRASDFLWVSETVAPEGEQDGKKIQYANGSLKISLQHAMSKLVLNCRCGTELEGIAVTNVVVKNLENACLLNLSAGTVQPPATSVRKDIIAYKAETAKAGYDVAYEVIFPPQATAFAVMIELGDGRKFLHENAEYDFQSDCRYELDIVFGKDKMELTDNGVSASDWQGETDKYLEVQ